MLYVMVRTRSKPRECVQGLADFHNDAGESLSRKVSKELEICSSRFGQGRLDAC